MAQNTIVQVTDDITGEEGAETVAFSLAGIDYQIDLSEKNRIDLEDALAQFIEHARKVRRNSTRPASHGKRDDKAGAIRAWADRNGYAIAARGRIPSDVREAYEAASS